MAEGFRNLRIRGNNLRKKRFLGNVLLIQMDLIHSALSASKNTGFKKISQEGGQISSGLVIRGFGEIIFLFFIAKKVLIFQIQPFAICFLMCS